MIVFRWSSVFSSDSLFLPNFSSNLSAEGIRQNTPSVYAFTNARIIQAPGKIIEKERL
jgi:hypothetical protein